MHLILLLLKLLCFAATMRAQGTVNRVEFSGRPFTPVPFNASNLLRIEEGAQEFPPLGPVRVIRGLMSTPSFFPITMSIYTRTRSITDIYLRPTDHLVLTRDGRKTSVRYEFNLNELVEPLNPYDPTKRIIMIIPGYLTGTYVQWMQDCRESWLNLEDVNVVLVHWSGGNKGLYSTAVSNVKLIARQITIFLYYLAQVNGLDFESGKFRESITIVGHSLGAHVAAFVGQELDGQVGRITGLDPAGPIFDKQKNSDRLDPSDAILVDVLHTNAGRMRYMKAGLGLLKTATKRLLDFWNSRNSTRKGLAESLLSSYSSDDDTAWFGLEYPSGHLDYYANGGSVQPGCNDELHLCDHRRAYYIYMQAIEFEVRARQAYGGESDTVRKGLHRLIAFPSEDYDGFRSGSLLLRDCPMLIMSNSLMDSGTRDLAYKQCTVPLDFVTPGRELRRELEEEYGLPLSAMERWLDTQLDDNQTADYERRRLYFETLSREPFVSEHHLMQIHLPRNQKVDWGPGCRFTCKIESNQEEELFSLIDYAQEKLEPVEYEQFYGLCFIFANPVDWRGSRRSVSADESKAEEEDRELAVPAYERSLKHFTPGLLSFEVSYNGVVLNNVRLPHDEKANGGALECRLDINALRIKGLTALAYNVSSWYLEDSEGSTVHSKNENRSGKIFPIRLSPAKPYTSILPESMRSRPSFKRAASRMSPVEASKEATYL